MPSESPPCGGDDEGGGGGGAEGRTSLTIYSSLPLQGDSRPQSESVVNGMKLALEEAGGKVGKFTVKYKSLDDATAAAGKWEPGQTSANARKAAQDASTIAYLGEFNSGASAISIPIINEAGILQVSPSNTYVGLTRAEGADKGEPDKYYPSGKRTYGRVVPADHIQAAAQVAYQKDEGCTKLYILNDKEVYGKGIADQVASDRQGPGPAGPRQRRHRHQGGELPHAGHEDQLVRRRLHVLRRHHPEQGRAGLHGRPRGQLGHQAVRPRRRGRVALHLQAPQGGRRRRPTSPTRRSTRSSTRASAQEFFDTFEQKYGKAPEPYAIYGYEAMKVALLAIQNAGDKGNDRQAVIDAFFNIKDRDSVLGQVLDRRERRHHAVRLRREPRRGRRAGLRQGPQGAGRHLITDRNS